MILQVLLSLGLVVSGCSAAPTSSLVEEVPECSPPFSSLSGWCIFVDPVTTGTWPAMRTFCQDLGGDLVVLQDANLFADLIFYIEGQGWEDKNFWVGGSDADHEGVWTWVDGSPMRMGSPYWAYRDDVQLPDHSSYENYAVMDNAFFHYLNDASNSFSGGHPVCELF